MDLRKYDGKCVSITDRWGETVEGVCEWNSEEYDEHEFGRREESLGIMNFLFYAGDIVRIESLEGHTGPYGRFSAPYGRLEELIVEDGFDSIEDALDSEEPEHIVRVLACLERRLDPFYGYEIPDRGRVAGAVKMLAGSASDDDVKKAAQRLAGLIESWG